MRLFAIATVFITLAGSAAATAARPAKSGYKPPTLRLPTIVKPIRYAARLVVRPTEPKFEGSIDIDVQIDQPTDVVWLNGTHLDVSKTTITVGNEVIPARTVAGGEDFIGLTTGRTLAAGPARLHLDYRAPISRTDDRGLFAQKENDRWYAISQFEAIFARLAFPCFDEPSYKVPWQLTLEVPESDVALSNTKIVAEKREHPGMKTVTFAPTPPLPSYLVAFAVGPYEVIDAGKAGLRGTPMRVAVPAGRGKDAQYAATTSGKLIELLEQYFGSAYPYDKLDVVAIPLPTDFGAMENPGLVTDAQGLLVAPPSAQGINFQREYSHVNAHEFAHQWFGDLVTTAWWDDIWLNESFANWLEAKVIEQWRPEWSHGTLSVTSRAKALGSDTLVSARQIRQPIVNDDDIINIFDPITYEKGQSVLSMIEHFVGAEPFQRGIRKYIAAHANGNANADQFIAAIGEAAGRDLGASFRSFLNQPGAPLVDVSLSCSGKPTVTFKQQRFLPLGSKGSTNKTWEIPVCVRYVADGKTQRACTMLKDAEAQLTLAANSCPTWLLGNDDSVGYFRSAYSGDLLAHLVSADGMKKLALHELLGVLDDVDALMKAARMPAADALALTPQLAADPRRLVATKGVDLLRDLRDQLVPPALEPAYARVVDKLFGARAHALGWQARPGEDDDTRLLRPEIVGLVADAGADKALQKEAFELTQRWLVDPKAVSPDVVEALLVTAARNGDQQLFNQLHAAARAQKDRELRGRLLAGLSSFRDPRIVARALEITLSDELDPRESIWILRQAADQHETRQLAWDFFRKHYDAYLKRLPSEMMAESPGLASGFCDEPHRREMLQFFKDRSPKLPGGPRLLEQAVERSELCQAANAAQQPSVAAFLRRW